MRWTPSQRFASLAAGLSKYLRLVISVRQTVNLTDGVTAGTWVDVTDRIDNDSVNAIASRVEYGIGQFTSDTVTLRAIGINWWNTNVLNYVSTVELKIDLYLGTSESDWSTADGGNIFCGIVDAIRTPDDLTDTIELNIYTYDDLGSRLAAETVTQQIVDPTSGGVILPSIPGITVTNSAMVNYLLRKGIHTINYDYNGGSPRANLDGGLWVALTSTTTFVLGNDPTSTASDTQRVTIYANVTILTYAGGTTSSQQIVVNNEQDTLPKTWLSRQWIFNVLKRFFAAMGCASFKFDDLSLNTFDRRNVTSYLDVPPGTSYVGKPRSMIYDATKYGLWFAVGTCVYYRGLAPGSDCVLVNDFGAGNTVLRLMDDLLSSNKLVVLTRDGSNYYWCGQINTSTMTLTSNTKLTNRGTSDATNLGCLNFAIGKTYGAGGGGSLFYCATSGADAMYWFDLINKTETLMNGTTGGAPQYALGGCADSSNGYILVVFSGGNYRLDYGYDMGGNNWFFSQLLSGAAFTPFEQGVYKGDEIHPRMYYCETGGNNLKFYDFNTDSLTTVESGVGHHELSLVQRPGVLSQIASLRTVASPYKQWPCLTINGVMTQIFPEITNPLGTNDGVVPPNSMAYDPVGDRWFGIFTYSQLVWQYGKTISMYVFDDIVGTGKSLIDVVRELCLGYQLMCTVSSSKTAMVYRRTDNAGNSQNSGNVLAISRDMVASISVQQSYRRRFNVVQMDNSKTGGRGWYDGIKFQLGDPIVTTTDQLLSVTCAYVPTSMLNDMLFFLWRAFDTDMDLVRVEIAGMPLAQWESFDAMAVDVDLDDMSYHGLAQIVNPEIGTDGTVVLAGLAPHCAQMDYSSYDFTNYA